MKISNSRLDLYNLCPRKYKYSYIEKLRTPTVYSSLVFGKAIDEALNYILICKRDNKKINKNKALKIFLDKLDDWDKSFKFEFYKKEVPKEALELNDPDKLMAVLERFKTIGKAIIQTYIEDVLPKFKRIIDVQLERKVQNQEQDELTMVIDFIAELEDGRIVLMDNKTTSSTTSYRDVKNSQQLALYSEHFDVKYCGYLVLNKEINKEGKVDWELIVDEPLETKRADVYTDLVKTLDKIKNQEYHKNEKACFSFGRKCEFYSYCKFGNTQNIIKENE